jgi:hypothetical protein
MFYLEAMQEFTGLSDVLLVASSVGAVRCSEMEQFSTPIHFDKLGR